MEKISDKIVGLTFDPTDFQWGSRDVILYALGVGATPPKDLDYVYEGKGPRVLPTYAVIPGMLSMGGLIGKVEINLGMLLHGEQGITLHRELPAEAKVKVVGKVKAVWDKGKAAVVETEGVVQDSNGPLATTRSTLFIRGAGGFGGERGPSTEGVNEPPDRKPDHEIKDHVFPQQGAIYRLSGDPNPMHIDPEFAQNFGFEAPYFHGLGTYGIVGRAILGSVCGNDPTRFTSFSARFADRVMYEDDIITKIWVTGPGTGIVRAETQKGNTVLSQAKATWKN
jgi:acyl dehydratase